MSVEQNEVSFRYRPSHGSATQSKKILRLPAEEFLRRFLLHVLPSGFKRIRHYGLTANRHKALKLAASRTVLNAPAPIARSVESVEAFLIRVTGYDPARCQHCHNGRLRVIRHLPRPMRLPQLRATGPPPW